MIQFVDRFLKYFDEFCQVLMCSSLFGFFFGNIDSVDIYSTLFSAICFLILGLLVLVPINLAFFPSFGRFLCGLSFLYNVLLIFSHCDAFPFSQ